MSDMQSKKKKRIINKLSDRDGFHCHYCGCPLEENGGFGKDNYNPKGSSIDHIVPQNEGGTDDLENLVLCCRQCNIMKKTKHYQVFAFAKATDLMILAMMEGEE